MNPYHADILAIIKAKSGKPSQHTLSDSYLGNTHPKYAIRVPALRQLAKDWMKEHQTLSTNAFAQMLTSLVKGESSTEKCLAGILLDYATPHQRAFPPTLFYKWLSHTQGWVEVDTLCTCKYAAIEIPSQWETWKPVIRKLAQNKSMEKRRASLVLFCAPVRTVKSEKMVTLAFDNIKTLCAEKDILITKAISWLLRSLIKHHMPAVEEFIEENKDILPAIALRETIQKLKTGRKSTKKV